MDVLKNLMIMGMLITSLGTSVHVLAMRDDRDNARVAGYESEEESEQVMEQSDLAQRIRNQEALLRNYEEFFEQKRKVAMGLAGYKGLLGLCQDSMTSVEDIKKALRRGAKVNVVDKAIFSDGKSYSATPLEAAVYYNRRDIVELLLAHKADVNLSGGDLGSPLRLAIMLAKREASSNKETSRELAAVLCDDGSGNGLLLPSLCSFVQDYADKQEGLDIMRMLLEKNAKITYQDLGAAIHCRNEQAQLLLLNSNNEVSLCQADTQRLLTYGRECGPWLGRFLVQKDAIKSKDSLQELLYQMARTDHADVVQALIEKFKIDIDYDGFEDDGYTLLMEAANHGAVGVVKMLIAQGAYPNIRTTDGNTALMYAVNGVDWASRVDVFKEIIEILLMSEARGLTEKKLASCRQGRQDVYRAVQDKVKQQISLARGRTIPQTVSAIQTLLTGARRNDLHKEVGALAVLLENHAVPNSAEELVVTREVAEQVAELYQDKAEVKGLIAFLRQKNAEREAVFARIAVIESAFDEEEEKRARK